jgi:hypothetical protein
MRFIRWIAGFLTIVLLLAVSGRAAAHGRTEVGDYELVIGFHNEPAYQDEVNGLDLFVTDKRTGDPVNGLEETLRVEIIYGSSTRELPLRPQFGREGAYTADVIPTEAGDYTWHIFGDIEGTPVDVRMTSGPDTFGSVEAKDAVLFPGPQDAAGETAPVRSAMLLAGAGLAFGLLGTIAGVLGFAAARRRV